MKGEEIQTALTELEVLRERLRAELAAAFDRLCDFEMLEKMSHQTREMIGEKYSWEHSENDIRKLIRSS